MKDKPVILIVDDEPQNIELLEAYLVPQGYEIVKAANGKEALEKLSANQIDLILLDVKMPDMDGFEVTRRIRQDDTNRLLPIILVTVLRETGDRVKGIEAGCDDFISYPVDKMELLARVRSLLKVKAYNDLMSSYRKELESEVTRRTEELKQALENLQQDITERKQVEDTLNKNEKKYRELYDFLPIPVYEMDFESNITSANRAIYETFRGTEEDFKRGFKGWQLLSPEEVDKSAKNIQRLLKGEKIEGNEYTLARLDGSVFPAIVISSVIYSNDKPVGLRGAIVDITERKRAEQGLRESEERYRALFDRSLDLVYVTDFEGRFIDANDAALNRLGYTREEILSLNFASLLSEDQLPLAIKIIQEIRETGIQMSLLELRLRHKNGSDVYVETQGSTIMSNGIPVAIQAVARDITERKRAEAEFHQTLESLRRAFGATIQVLVSAVEVRDPYTAGHQLRSTNLAIAIATEMGLPQEKIDGIRMAGSIHDIGKLSIPAEILSKPTKLTNVEFSLIREHSQSGYEMLKDVESPWPLAQIVYQHHERMDGSGYPRNLKGDEILLEARILAVADVVEAIASHRPYRPARGIDIALKEISENKGILYDIDAVDACLRLFREKGYKLLE